MRLLTVSRPVEASGGRLSAEQSAADGEDQTVVARVKTTEGGVAWQMT